MNKVSKTPAINRQTRLLSFDLESNGLHGKAFAVGAVVMGADGQIYDEFTARARLTSKVDDWVKNNVLPVIGDMPITHNSYEELIEAFWSWYIKAEKDADYVLVNNGYPVEYNFLLDCQKANLEERYWQHPFPLLELSSLLLMTSSSSGSGKRAMKKSLNEDYGRTLHHPLEDAKMAAKMAFEAFRLAGKI